PMTITSYCSRMAVFRGAGSERLQVLEQLVLLLGRQVSAIEVPGVAVAAHAGIVLPAELLCLGPARDVAYVVVIEDVIRPIELLGALGRRRQQGAQRRHGAVVEVRRAQPDAVERRVGVAAGLAEVRQLPRVAGAERVLLVGERLGERSL